MAINVNALPDYVNERKDELFVRSTAGAKTLEYVEIMPNVKYKDALNYLDSTITLADGSQCGWNPQGDDTFTQRYIEVKPVSVQKEFCWKEFRQKYANYDLAFQAGREKLPFEEKFAESNVAAIMKGVEDLVWKGNEGLGIAGFISQIEGEETSVKVNDNQPMSVVEAIKETVKAIPAAALEKGANIFLSWTNFRAYVAEMNESCCGSMPIIDAAVEALVYAGDSRVTLVPVAGLEGTGKVVSASKDALVYGTDLEGSEGVYEIFYDKKESKYLFNVLFNAGTAVKFPDEVTIATVA